MNEPLISVIIPAHNSARSIGTALQSIIGQTWKNLEIVVIDDNSADATKAVVATYAAKDDRIRYFALGQDDPNRINRRGRNINAGYMARNLGFEKARGEYITFQDADDASFANRIRVQYEFLVKYRADHVTIDWQRFDDSLVGQGFDAERYMAEHPAMMGPRELAALAHRTKGIAYKMLGRLCSSIDFEFKRTRGIQRLFFGTHESYPGTGNSPLFKKSIVERVRFRKLDDRVWPSFAGRGADRDFNFQIAETFKNSYVFFVPLYLWRQKDQNVRYRDTDLRSFLV